MSTLNASRPFAPEPCLIGAVSVLEFGDFGLVGLIRRIICGKVLVKGMILIRSVQVMISITVEKFANKYVKGNPSEKLEEVKSRLNAALNRIL